MTMNRKASSAPHAPLERIVRAGAGLCIVLAVLSCTGATEAPGAHGASASPFTVSAPNTTPAAAMRDVLDADAASAEAESVYVALPAGAIPNARDITIRVQSGGASLTVPALDGGMDPVAVRAATGDTLEITVATVGNDSWPFTNVVPSLTRPTVIRTSPAPRKRDVPLNPTIIVVFSEPIAAASLTSSSVVLTKGAGGNPVAGTLAFIGTSHLFVSFTPATQLDPLTDYTLTVTRDIRNIAGQPLADVLSVSFTTADVSTIDPAHLVGIYERETPQRVIGRNSRYLIYDDGSFQAQSWAAADTTVFTGRWKSAQSGSGFSIEPGSILILDFDGFSNDGCGEGYGAFLVRGHLGIALCSAELAAGLEEGVYTTDPIPNPPGPPPSQTGQIAFVRDGRIHLVNTDGGGLVPISSGPNDRSPAWSPDGKRIAFVRNSGATSGIFVMDADGGNVVQRAAPSVNETLNAPTWSPDGQWLAYDCRAGGGGICKVKADDDGSAPINVIQQPGKIYFPAWSRDGTRIAFTTDYELYDIYFDIWVVDPDGSHASALITHTVSVPNRFESYQAAWAPDGQTIAFVSCTWAFYFCSSSAISVMRADGSGIQHLVATSGFASPTWSPDGRVIAFGSGSAIDWVAADGSQRGRIIDNGSSPAWRP